MPSVNDQGEPLLTAAEWRTTLDYKAATERSRIIADLLDRPVIEGDMSIAERWRRIARAAVDAATDADCRPAR